MKKQIFNQLMLMIKNGIIEDPKIIDAIFIDESNDSHDELWKDYIFQIQNSFISELMGASEVYELNLSEDSATGEQKPDCSFENTTSIKYKTFNNEKANQCFQNKDEILLFCKSYATQQALEKVVDFLTENYRLDAITPEMVKNILKKHNLV